MCKAHGEKTLQSGFEALKVTHETEDVGFRIANYEFQLQIVNLMSSGFGCFAYAGEDRQKLLTFLSSDESLQAEA